MAAFIPVSVWRALPFFVITLLAGLVAIPKDLYEAAHTDGANAWSRFWHITLPLLKPVLAVVVLFSTIFTFSDFNIVYVLTHGGPINSTHLFATYSRMIGLESGRIGEVAAAVLDEGAHARAARALPRLRAVPLLPHDADVAEAGPRALRPPRGAAR